MEVDIHDHIKKSVIKSQHCQRNWDLTKTIPKEDLDLIVHAATQCPSKQNIAYYGVHFVTNRNIIEKIHQYTNGFNINGYQSKVTTTNSQVLANLLVVFEDIEYIANVKQNQKIARNAESSLISNKVDGSNFNFDEERALRRLNNDKMIALGIASGYVNLTASILGYSTGCCICMHDTEEISKVVGMKGQPLLLMGIGFKDINRPRREHHLDKNIIFPTFKKQEIPIKIID